MPNDLPSLAVGDQLSFSLTREPDTTPIAVTLSLVERAADLTTRRIWTAAGDDGMSWRVEEYDDGDDDPDAVPVFPGHVDLPVAATAYHGRLVRVYRHVEGVLLAQRLAQLGRPVTPAELQAWLDPVLDMVERFHQAGYVCLRLCPYSIKFRTDGQPFLQNVAGLYRLDRLPGSLPAIIGYTAPEIYHTDFTRAPSVAADIFSLAMVAWYMLTLRDPPVSMYTSHTPALNARDLSLELPCGLHPMLVLAGAALPTDRPASIAQLRSLLHEAVRRAVARTVLLPDLRFTVAAETHPGVFKRVHQPINQDAVYCAHSRAHDLALVAVSDGVSTASYGTGDLASRLALRRIQETWNELLAQPQDLEQQGPTRLLSALMQSINYDIVAWINEHHAPFHGEPSEVMGATCVIALAHRGICTVASIGDSRIYLVRPEGIEPLSRDHNLTTLGLIEGMDPDAALLLPQGDALARCLGLFDLDGEGRLIPQRLLPDVLSFFLQPGDIVLLCSDGLTDFAGPGTTAAELAIWKTLQHEAQPELAALELIRLANLGGGGDNIGIALLYADPNPRSIVRWAESLRAGESSLEWEDSGAQP
jgi:protein phosphatase